MDKQEIESLFCVEDNRVLFTKGFLSKLIKIVVKKVGSQTKLAKEIGISSSSITRYKKGLRLPSCKVVKKIAQIAKINISTVRVNIKEIRRKDWWRSEAGKKGGRATFRKYGPQFYRELNRKLREKYGNEFFRMLGFKTCRKYGKNFIKRRASKGGRSLSMLYPEEKKRWGRKGSAIGSERKWPTSQEENLIEENVENGILNFSFQKTISNKEEIKNFDFIYFLKGKIMLIEEATDELPVKNRMYSKVLEIYEKKKFLERAGIQAPIILTLNSAKRSRNIIRVPLDALIILLQEGILPVFYDLNPQKRICLIKEILSSPVGYIPQEYKAEVKNWIRSEANRRMKEMKKGAIGQLKIPMNREEIILNQKLIDYGFKPKGKYFLLSKYGAIVVDNFVKLRNTRIFFEVKRVKDRRSFMKAALDLASKFFILKRLYDNQAKCVAVLVSTKKIRLNSESYQIKLLRKYSDIIIENDEYEKLQTLKVTCNVGK
jgi:transcriptional regulator with XRE-family HTH domain